jgi:hypothetical protein
MVATMTRVLVIPDSKGDVMSRFKFGIIIGFGLGWAVGSGKAKDLVDEVMARTGRGDQGGRGQDALRPFDRPADRSTVSA